MQKSIVCLCVMALASVANAATNWRPAANGIVPPATGNWNTAANWNNGLPVLVGGSSTYGTHTKAVLNAGAATAECQVTDVQGAVNVVIGDGGPGGDVLRIMSGGDLTSTGWLAVGYSRNCQMIVETGGVANLDSHLWMAATNALATNCILDINGGTVNVGGNIGLGTVNASTPSGGTAFINVNAGVLALDHWSATGSIQNGSVIDIELGVVTIVGNQTSTVAGYEGAGRITAYGGAGTVHYDTTTNPGKTTIWAEPASVILGNGDVNGDGDVDETDLLLFTAQWLDPDPDPDADFTRDDPAKVDMADCGILAKNWKHNEYSRTLTGKIMCGYQGWFNHPGDGAGRGWVHWGRSNKFEPGYCTVDWWPDVSEYDADELYPTGFNYANGSTAYVFSSHNEKTVRRHFSWMAEYGIDGVFLQRFATETTPGSASRNNRDNIMLYCQDAANLHKRAWAMMYDLSGLDSGTELKQKVESDWKHLVDTYGITKDHTDAAYLHHNGKPVVAVWGLGFGRAYEGQQSYEFIEFLKNDPTYGGCTVMIGVQNSWRTNTDTWFQQIVQLADIISPWAVGRYGSTSTNGLNNFTTNHTIPDQAWCNANGKDYLPVVFPGFSWQNLQQNNKFDQTPRLGGAFLWRQIYKAIHDAGVTMIYQAMFDEVDEGTAIFKCTNNPPVAELPTSVFSNPFLPTGNAQYSPYDPSDASLPSDHYLWLVGEAGKMLRGETVLTETMPTR